MYYRKTYLSHILNYNTSSYLGQDVPKFISRFNIQWVKLRTALKAL